MFKLTGWIEEDGEIVRYIRDGLDGLLEITEVLEELETKSVKVLEVHIYKEIR